MKLNETLQNFSKVAYHTKRAGTQLEI